VGTVALAVVVVSGCQPLQPWRHTVASGNSAGTVGGDGGAREPIFSADGTKLAFVSSSGDLGPTDPGDDDDVYVRDLATGTTTLVSVNAAGTDGGDSESSQPTFSADGTEIAFRSSASDLVTPAAPGGGVYVRDLTAGTTTLIAPGAGSPEFSPTDDAVAYGTGADVHLHDLTTGTTSLVSVDAAGTGPGNGPSQLPNFSPDGTKIAFQSYATDLVTSPADTNDGEDVFVRDLATGTTTLVSANAAGTGSGNQISFIGNIRQQVFSADGTKAVFTSLASDLVGGDANRTLDVFVRDLTAGTTSLVSANAAGTGSGELDSMYPRFSPDGTKVAFASLSSDLEPIAREGGRQNVFVRDLVAGTTTLVSVNAAGTDGGNGPSGVFWNDVSPTVFSSDSRRLVFPSRATDLGPRDTGCTELFPAPASCTDVYVRDLATATTTLVSTNAAGDDSANAPSGPGTFGPDPELVALVSSATDLGPTRPAPNAGQQVYLSRLTGGDLSLAVEGHATSPSALSYELDVANAGPDPAAAVTVALLLPEQATFVDADSPCTPPTATQPRVVTCPLGTVAPGAPGTQPTIGVRAELAPGVPGGSTVTAVGIVSSSTVDPVPADNTVREDVAVP
jgi:Tol biopolymer transport system component